MLPTYQQIRGLTYVNQILSETLRLWPTVSAFTRYPYDGAMVGPYIMPKGSSITGFTIMLHRDPNVWGADAEEYNPDHFRPETRSQIPPNAFKPFGSGQRACIGRQFAMQEAMLVLGMLLQRFEFVDYLDYELKVKRSDDQAGRLVDQDQAAPGSNHRNRTDRDHHRAIQRAS